MSRPGRSGGYFAKWAADVRQQTADGSARGFRPAQLAAAHAVSAHCFGSTDPAIVTMPTGSGKTAVMR